MQIEIKIEDSCKEPKVIILTASMTEEVNSIIKKLSEDVEKELDGKYQSSIPASETAPEAPKENALWVDKRNLRLKLWDGEQWQTVGYEPTIPTEPETPDIEKPGSEDKDTENKEEIDNKETDQEGGSS